MELQHKLINPKLKSSVQSRNSFVVHKDITFIRLNLNLFFFSPWVVYVLQSTEVLIFHPSIQTSSCSPVIFSFSFNAESVYAFPVFYCLYLNYKYS